MDLVRIFENASERIMTGQNSYACCAIVDASAGPAALVAVNLFIKLFKPKGKSVDQGWFGYLGPEAQLARSLALLFVAEILKEGEI